jgi:uncharacterized Zn-binding protein involved in type VI secretion
MKPAARVGDVKWCPKTSPGPHFGGPIVDPCCSNVLTGGKEQARVTDATSCTSESPTTTKAEPGCISQGVAMVLVGGLPASALGHTTTHGGVIMTGHPLVLLGGASVTLEILDEGDEMFRKKLQESLARLFSTPSGVQWLEQMAATGKTVRFKSCRGFDTSEEADSLDDSSNGKGTDSTIYWNPYHRDENDPNGDAGLAHEMVHSLHDAKGQTGTGPYDRYPGYNYPSNRAEERSTVGTLGQVRQPDGTYEPHPKDYSKDVPTENSFRKDLGLPPRKTYFSDSQWGSAPW